VRELQLDGSLLPSLLRLPVITEREADRPHAAPVNFSSFGQVLKGVALVSDATVAVECDRQPGPVILSGGFSEPVVEQAGEAE
jgi:hypothetical protein